MKNDVIFVQIIGLVFLSGLGLGEPNLDGHPVLTETNTGCDHLSLSLLQSRIGP